MIKFSQFKKTTFLTEGGNIKVGNVAAAPIDVVKHGREQLHSDVHEALSQIHDSFHKEHGVHLFGDKKQALSSGSAFSGSSKHLATKAISTEDFLKHKSHVGDIDVQIPKEHGDKLATHLTTGKKFGKYTVAGIKKHGNEVSAIMKHEDGTHHQFDFEKTDYENHEPSEFEQFAHSSSWKDTKAGIKGVHHKKLLNAIGGEHLKFSITHGLRHRADDSMAAEKSVKGISNSLFGKEADHSKMHSFQGLTELIKKHVPEERHQEIFDKFKKDATDRGQGNAGPALEHMKKHLNVIDHTSESLDEAEETHHTTVVPITG
jgi:hypothetical protein